MNIKLNKNWAYLGLARMDFEAISTPVKQLMRCIPKEEDRTQEEEKLFAALKTIHEFIEKYGESEYKRPQERR